MRNTNEKFNCFNSIKLQGNLLLIITDTFFQELKISLAINFLRIKKKIAHKMV